ncbi:MAG: hypothetical protein HY040_16870 [Planctomycetes bacterium]|nr:hypothetical protein [Planctomycetota bacterium]
MFSRKFALPRWTLPLVTLLIFGAAAPRVAAQQGPPTLVFRVRSLDTVVENVKLLVSLAGREEVAKQVEGLIKTKIGAKGLEGVDPTRPFGGYARLGNEITDVFGAVLIPIADEKAFLSLLENLNVPFNKGKDGIYTVQGPGIDAYFRFANKYLYVTALNRHPIEGDNLPDPAKILGGSKAAISLTVRLDQLPEAARNLAQLQVEEKLKEAEDKGPPNESPAQKAFRIATLREFAKTFVGVIKDGSELSVDFDLDKNRGDFSIGMTLGAVPKSDLAKALAAVGQRKSLFAGLRGKDNAFFGAAHAALPEDLKKALGKVIDEGMTSALAGIREEKKKSQAESVFKALAPTFRAGEIDGAVALNGPNDNKTYTFVAAAKLRDGDKLAQTLRDLANDVLGALPDRERDKIKLNFDSAGSVKIHRLELDAAAQGKKEWKKLVDDPYVYLAFRDDAVFVAGGKDALKAIKAAVAMDKAASIPVFVLEFDLARMAPLLEDPGLAKNLFGDGRDGRVGIWIDGGERLNLRLQGRLAVVQFFSQLKQRNAGE